MDKNYKYLENDSGQLYLDFSDAVVDIIGEVTNEKLEQKKKLCALLGLKPKQEKEDKTE